LSDGDEDNRLQRASMIEFSERQADGGAGPPLHNLLLTGAELAALLPGEARRGDWLNAYLIVAGLNQIAEDELHRDTLLLGAIGDHFVSMGGRPHRIVGRGAESTAAAVQRTRSTRRSWRALLAWQRSLAGLVDVLADRVVGVAPSERPEQLVKTAELIASGLPLDVRDQVQHLPSCFQAFDLAPGDIRELVHRFSRAWVARERPLLVVGVRTSGSFMAPLCASFLRLRGYGAVRVLTLRPEHQLLHHEQAIVRALARRDGLALIIDDPPGSGRSVATAVRRVSLDERSIVLLLPLFGGEEALPSALRRYPAILLASDDWAIRSKLTPTSVGDALTRLLDGKVLVAGVQPVAIPARRWPRGHERALFNVEVERERGTDAASVLVEGVGIGYYAEHAAAIALALEAHVPEVYGVEEGCLFREWLPEAQRADSGRPDDAFIEAVARYATDRSFALPTLRDVSTGLARQRPVWEVASRFLSRSFGRGAPAARWLFVDALAKQLLHVRRPSIVDGRTGLSNWFFDDRKPSTYVKSGFVEYSFWSLGLSCYDAVFDLAGAAVSSADEETADRLRSAYERLSGEQIDDERWLLYELAQLWGRQRVDAIEPWELERACSRALQWYIRRIYLADLETPSVPGPICAVDLDGVLETQALAFPATTAAGARALRALLAHGCRPILVTGRSAHDVGDRCLAYSLDGGVAEYGSAVCTTAPRQVHVLVPESDRLLLDRLRDSLATLEGVSVDPSYTHSVRAFCFDRSGRRRGLDAPTIARALADSQDGSRLRAIAGAAQTDFTSASVDKGIGVRALIDRLGRAGQEVILAVGDTATDLPMLRLAKLALAPRNADATLRRTANVQVLDRPYQSGFVLAVERLIGHTPGSCPICRTPLLTPEARMMLAVISAQERGLLGLANRFAQLSTRNPARGMSFG
jgi:hypothetical protein